MPAACAANALATDSANSAAGSRSATSARLTTRSLIMPGSSMPLEVLHRVLVLERGRARRKRSEIAPLAGFRVLLARIEAVLARRKLADHGGFSLPMLLAICAPVLTVTAILQNLCSVRRCRMSFACM